MQTVCSCCHACKPQWFIHLLHDAAEFNLTHGRCDHDDSEQGSYTAVPQHTNLTTSCAPSLTLACTRVAITHSASTMYSCIGCAGYWVSMRSRSGRLTGSPVMRFQIHRLPSYAPVTCHTPTQQPRCMGYKLCKADHGTVSVRDEMAHFTKSVILMSEGLC